MKGERDQLAHRVPTRIYWYDGTYWVPHYRQAVYINPRGATMAMSNLIAAGAIGEAAWLWPRLWMN
jgi:hypothetical protein